MSFRRRQLGTENVEETFLFRAERLWSRILDKYNLNQVFESYYKITV